MEAAKAFQQKVESVVERVSNGMLPVQRKTVECSLRCFDQHKDFKAVGQCIEGCQKPFAELGESTQREFGNLQKSIDACAQVCRSRVEPKFEAVRNDPAGQQGLQREMEECVGRCFKDAEPALADVERRIADRRKALM
eukprot:TRINITY_DN9368_c0_g1_i1.p2 TRINITY_DN9368_c0_g1~~TRINITY_DN9368_c0_g1_i1.p2  ORF type:complete len:154 (-),score=40.29 TRINITY_DN9368_c0_g1_i1:54-467(-)